MTSQLIETVDINASVQFSDDTSDVDPAYADVVRVSWLSTSLLSAIVSDDPLPKGEKLKEIVESESSACVFSDDLEEYTDELLAAAQLGDEVMNGDGAEERQRDLAANIDVDELRELRASIGYVGQHFGIDVTLPALGEVRER